MKAGDGFLTQWQCGLMSTRSIMMLLLEKLTHDRALWSGDMQFYERALWSTCKIYNFMEPMESGLP
jgi:hypothetical protein